ncbi:MAG: tetratricopeptide repeat protein [Sulfurimonas sp.]|nr:tetratricopeptide repeat protein [Sulfurimonas sp.]
MTIFQLLMLGASAYFAYKIYEHIQTLKDKEEGDSSFEDAPRTAEAFSTFSPEALVQRADEAFENDDKEKALALLIEANAKDAKNADILFKIAYILNQTGNSDDALSYYKEALEVDEENEYVHNAIASIYREKGEFASAKNHLQASIDIDAANPVTYYNYGNLLVDMHKNDEAIVMYEKALELNPDFAEVKEELAKIQG